MTTTVKFELHDGRTIGPVNMALAQRCLRGRSEKIRRTLIKIDGHEWASYERADEAEQIVSYLLAEHEETDQRVAAAVAIIGVPPVPTYDKERHEKGLDFALAMNARPLSVRAPDAYAAAVGNSRCFRCGHTLIICQCGVVDPNEAMKKRDGAPQPTAVPVPYDWETRERGLTIQRALRKTFAGLERLTLGGYHP